MDKHTREQLNAMKNIQLCTRKMIFDIIVLEIQLFNLDFQYVKNS